MISLAMFTICFLATVFRLSLNIIGNFARDSLVSLLYNLDDFTDLSNLHFLVFHFLIQYNYMISLSHLPILILASSWHLVRACNDLRHIPELLKYARPSLHKFSQLGGAEQIVSQRGIIECGIAVGAFRGTRRIASPLASHTAQHGHIVQ